MSKSQNDRPTGDICLVLVALGIFYFDVLCWSKQCKQASVSSRMYTKSMSVISIKLTIDQNQVSVRPARSSRAIQK